MEKKQQRRRRRRRPRRKDNSLCSSPTNIRRKKEHFLLLLARSLDATIDRLIASNDRLTRVERGAALRRWLSPSTHEDESNRLCPSRRVWCWTKITIVISTHSMNNTCGLLTLGNDSILIKCGWLSTLHRRQQLLCAIETDSNSFHGVTDQPSESYLIKYLETVKSAGVQIACLE